MQPPLTAVLKADVMLRKRIIEETLYKVEPSLLTLFLKVTTSPVGLSDTNVTRLS